MFDWKNKLTEVPKTPGVYEFLNKDGRVIYVGKAKNLKNRLGQYFSGHDTRTQIPHLLAEATGFTYTVVTSELEAAFLENTLIKQHSPKYNIDLKDDKNYAFITINYSTEIPQIGYARKIDPQNQKSKSIKYFGPYSAVHKIRATLNLIRRIFPYCANEKVSNRPCFYYYMHRCPGVCIGKISLDEYKIQLDRICEFLAGNNHKITAEITKEMKVAAKNKQFEKAARLRDSFRALEILKEKQNAILPKKVSWDIVSVGSNDGFACVNLFKVREGKLYDKESFVYELPGASITELGEVTQRFLEQYYIETSSRPDTVYLESLPKDSELIEHIISSRFNKKTKLQTTKKGQVKKLLDLGKVNAEEYLKNWLKDKAGNLDKINAALSGLKEILNLPQIPKRIECYDNSNIQGTNPVGSMVVFVDGLPAKSQYRKFKFTDKKKPDDFASMKEMLSRRLARIEDNSKWPMPDLIVIDGGKGQLSAAMEAISQYPNIPISVIGLAKRIEEIFLPNNSEPIILSHDHPSLQMLQRIRDEAHRFGITFHRSLRSKQAVKSALDDILGVGPKTKKLLKAKFGTVAEIKKQSLDELTKVVGKKLAEKIKASI